MPLAGVFFIVSSTRLADAHFVQIGRQSLLHRLAHLVGLVAAGVLAADDLVADDLLLASHHAIGGPVLQFRPDVGRGDLVHAEKGPLPDDAPDAAGKHQRTGGIADGAVGIGMPK